MYKASGIYGVCLSFVMQIRDDLKNGLILEWQTLCVCWRREWKGNGDIDKQIVWHEQGMIIALKA